ncbi:MAG: uracil-DNA glycosylase [Pseudomonadota bacterium]
MTEDKTITDHPVHLQELLAWYADAGLDYAMDDAPVDRFAEAKAAAEARKVSSTEKPMEQPSPPKPGPQKQATPNRQAIPNQQAVADAQRVASQADDLAAVKYALEGFEGCNLRFASKVTVFGTGDPNASLMIIGDPPGRDEEEENTPFAGGALTMLGGMLSVLGLEIEQTYCAPVIPWRPAGGVPPTPLQMQICLPFVRRQIALVKPRFLLVMGETATNGLLPNKGNILSTRGKWQDMVENQHTMAALPTLSPRYLLKVPAQKRFAFNDLLALKDRMNGAR